MAASEAATIIDGHLIRSSSFSYRASASQETTQPAPGCSSMMHFAPTRSLTTTGTPTAIASATTIPNESNLDGKIKQSYLVISSKRCGWSMNGRYETVGTEAIRLARSY